MASARASTAGGPDAVAAHDELCAALRGHGGPISTAAVELARRHRVHFLLAHVAASRVHDEAVRERLASELREAAIGELFRERELRRLLGQLADNGIQALLLKGAGLAYTVYEAPHLRMRTDLDLLIARRDLEAAEQTLLASGWMRVADQDRETVTTQRHYVLGGVERRAEYLDLHWNVAIPQIFRDALTYDELSSRAMAIGSLGPDARTLSLPDALFLACVHRVAHHQDAIDLIWLWDIHVLASRLSDGERACFLEIAARQRMRAICVRGLELASACFATPHVDTLLATLRPAAGDPREPSADFIGGSMRQIDLLRRDLSAVGWRGRLQMLGGHLVPSVSYIRSRYPHWPAAALPIAYLHRIVRGAPHWFRRTP